MGPAPRFPSDGPQKKIKGGVGLSQFPTSQVVSGGRLGGTPPFCKIFAASIFHMCNFTKCLIPGVQNVLAVWVGGRLGPNPVVWLNDKLWVYFSGVRAPNNWRAAKKTKAHFPIRLSSAQPLGRARAGCPLGALRAPVGRAQGAP